MPRVANGGEWWRMVEKITVVNDVSYCCIPHTAYRMLHAE
jgi:hypothetical protein